MKGALLVFFAVVLVLLACSTDAATTKAKPLPVTTKKPDPPKPTTKATQPPKPTTKPAPPPKPTTKPAPPPKPTTKPTPAPTPKPKPTPSECFKALQKCLKEAFPNPIKALRCGQAFIKCIRG